MLSKSNITQKLKKEKRIPERFWKLLWNLEYNLFIEMCLMIPKSFFWIISCKGKLKIKIVVKHSNFMTVFKLISWIRSLWKCNYICIYLFVNLIVNVKGILNPGQSTKFTRSFLTKKWFNNSLQLLRN